MQIRENARAEGMGQDRQTILVDLLLLVTTLRSLHAAAGLMRASANPISFRVSVFPW
jgi:hypothetical protein